MKPDAYDLLKQAIFLWQQNAMYNNDAGTLKKSGFEMELHVEIDGKLIKVTNVKHDRDNGIVFTTNK